MGNDLFGGLGGLVKGLSGLMPQEDPGVKLFKAQAEYGELEKKEEQQLAQIGRMAIEKYGIGEWGEAGEKLCLTRRNMEEAKKQLNHAENENQEADEQKRQSEECRTCRECGMLNPEGVKFCQECGTKLGAREKRFCPECGAEVDVNVRFCGECGHRMED